MATEAIVAFDNRPICQPVVFFIGRLLNRGFTILNYGDYKADYLVPNDESLHFRLQSSVKLDTLDLYEDSYYVAHIENNDYMCECHYHLVKLIDVL